MVEGRTQAGVRQQDRIFRQFEQLVERRVGRMARVDDDAEAVHLGDPLLAERTQPLPAPLTRRARSEEHTSELQSLMRISYAVFCLKKKNKVNKHKQDTTR